MKTEEMIITIRDKNHLIIKQTRRINLLESKLDEVRRKYFAVKYGRV